jgi:hypothetical protein
MTKKTSSGTDQIRSVSDIYVIDFCSNHADGAVCLNQVCGQASCGSDQNELKIPCGCCGMHKIRTMMWVGRVTHTLNAV